MKFLPFFVLLFMVVGCEDPCRSRLTTCSGDDDSSDAPTPGTVDKDGDGHASVESGGDDCNDADASVYPGADDLAFTCDQKDNDCDGQIDEDTSQGAILFYAYLDHDNDEHGAASSAILECSFDNIPPQYVAFFGDDCDDEDAAIYPYATETCNEKDDNCNGLIDDGVSCGVPEGAIEPD